MLQASQHETAGEIKFVIRKAGKMLTWGKEIFFAQNPLRHLFL
jgi:hypothetical protein